MAAARGQVGPLRGTPGLLRGRVCPSSLTNPRLRPAAILFIVITWIYQLYCQEIHAMIDWLVLVSEIQRVSG
jgi:hypothetical protein